jgi:hypothetical protein
MSSPEARTDRTPRTQSVTRSALERNGKPFMALCQGRPPPSAYLPRRQGVMPTFKNPACPHCGIASSFLAQNKMFSAQTPSALILGRNGSCSRPRRFNFGTIRGERALLHFLTAVADC